MRDVVARAHRHNDEIRANRRLEAQAGRRNIQNDDFTREISEKEAKTLANVCKSGKMSLAQFRCLSQAISEQADFADHFLSQDGCLHALVGYLTGRDAPKQVVLDKTRFLSTR